MFFAQPARLLHLPHRGIKNYNGSSSRMPLSNNYIGYVFLIKCFYRVMYCYFVVYAGSQAAFDAPLHTLGRYTILSIYATIVVSAVSNPHDFN